VSRWDSRIPFLGHASNDHDSAWQQSRERPGYGQRRMREICRNAPSSRLAEAVCVTVLLYKLRSANFAFRQLHSYFLNPHPLKEHPPNKTMKFWFLPFHRINKLFGKGFLGSERKLFWARILMKNLPWKTRERSMMKNPLQAQATRACHRHSSDPRPHIADCSDRSAVASFPSVEKERESCELSAASNHSPGDASATLEFAGKLT
jgi:hypothetical protein